MVLQTFQQKWLKLSAVNQSYLILFDICSKNYKLQNCNKKTAILTKTNYCFKIKVINDIFYSTLKYFVHFIF